MHIVPGIPIWLLSIVGQQASIFGGYDKKDDFTQIAYK